MINDELSVRFYLKCVDDKGVVTTYRFNGDTALKQFVSTMSQHKLAIVDTHIACYGVELLTPAFGVHIADIDHMDINLAKEMVFDNIQESDENTNQPILSDNKKVKSKKAKFKKTKFKKEKSDKKPKKDKVKKSKKKCKKLDKKVSKKHKE